MTERAPCMPRVTVEPGLAVNCEVDDFLWPWQHSTPVFMVHGFARSAEFWRRWVPLLGTTRPDLRGHGKSDTPPPGSIYSPDIFIDDLIKVMDAFGIERAHYVGEPGGG